MAKSEAMHRGFNGSTKVIVWAMGVLATVLTSVAGAFYWHSEKAGHSVMVERVDTMKREHETEVKETKAWRSKTDHTLAEIKTEILKLNLGGKHGP